MSSLLDRQAALRTGDVSVLSQCWITEKPTIEDIIELVRLGHLEALEEAFKHDEALLHFGNIMMAVANDDSGAVIPREARLDPAQ